MVRLKQMALLIFVPLGCADIGGAPRLGRKFEFKRINHVTMCRRYHHFATCRASTNEENFECDEVA